MRFRVDIECNTRTLAWKDVFGPARGVAYHLIRAADLEVAAELHDHGWDGDRLRPFGLSCPQFIGAPRVRGKYTTSKKGSIWFGSPIPRIAAALLGGLAGRTELNWGGTMFRILGVELESAPPIHGDEAGFTTATPVLVKCEGRFVAPEHPGFVDALVHNLRHKANLLGLPAELEIELTGAGPMRWFEVGTAPRRGATASLRVVGDPRMLAALYDWGIGLANNQGFGWLR